MLAKYFPSAAVESEESKSPKDVQFKSWCMELKNTTNHNIKKKEVLDFIFNSVDGQTNIVDLKSADLTIVIEVYREILMMGIAPRYKELKKYTLQ